MLTGTSKIVVPCVWVHLLCVLTAFDIKPFGGSKPPPYFKTILAFISSLHKAFFGRVEALPYTRQARSAAPRPAIQEKPNTQNAAGIGSHLCPAAFFIRSLYCQKDCRLGK